MAGTFGQQLSQQKSQQQQGRLTRTQRVLQKQQQEKTEREEIAKVTAYNEEIDRQNKEIERQNYLNSQQYQIDQYEQNLNNERTRLENMQIEHDKKILAYQQMINEAYKKGDSVLASKIDYRMYKYEVEFQENYADQQSVIKRYEAEKGKVYGGYTSESVIKNVQQRIEYRQQQQEAEREANKQLKAGTYTVTTKSGEKITQDQLMQTLKITNIPATKVNITELNKALVQYNKEMSYKEQLQKWGEKVGFVNLPEYAKEKINPSAIEWQRENPTEKLIFDKTGNVVAVESGIYGQTLSKENYDKRVRTEIEKIEADRLKQEKLTAEAKAVLIEKEFGKFEDPSKQKQTTKWYEKIWAGAKATYLSSPFGAFYGNIGEKTQEELTQVRESRIAESIKPQINARTGLPEIPIYKFFSLPYSASYKVITEQNQLDYEAKVYEDKFKELSKITEGVSDELKPYIEMEGMEVLRRKGLEMKEETIQVTSPKEILSGKVTAWNEQKMETQTVLTVTDPAFDRRISQNLLELEKTLSWDADTEAQKRIKGLAIGALSMRVIASKAVETYLVWKGGGAVIKGATSTYKLLGGGYKLEKAWMTGSGTVKGVLSKDFTVNAIRGREGFIIPHVKQPSKLFKYLLAGGVTTIYSLAKYRQYKQYTQTSEKAGALLFGLETIGEFGGIEMATGIGKRTYDIAKSNIKNWNVPIAKEADLTEKGFYRENKYLGGKEKIYMRRYQGFKLREPATWKPTLLRYPKGSFMYQARKIVSDEVTAYYKYGGDVDIYDLGGKPIKTYRSPTIWELQKSSALQRNIMSNKGQYIYRGRNVGTGRFAGVQAIEEKGLSDASFIKTIRATPFPYDKPSTHYDWLTRKNILEYGLGKQKALPIKIKEYKGFVYSATSKKWEYVEFKPDDLLVDGKVVAKLKGALRFGSGKGVSEGFLRIGGGAEESSATHPISSPTIYANYLRKVQINKAIGEFKGMTSRGLEVKFPVYTKDTGALGTGNVPLLKKEVELTYEFEKALPLRTRFAIRRGLWKVPVVEEVVGSSSELKALAKSAKLSAEITPIGQSSLPSSISSLNKAIYSIIGYSKPSRVSKTSYAGSVSEISRVSRVSPISRVSRVSRISQVSPKSRISRTSRSSVSYVNSRVSRIISEIKSRTSYRPRSPRPPRISPISIGLAGKIRMISKRKTTPEINALFPDFTARALGITPKRVKSVAEAMREINRIQTGFDIRTGARVAGYSPIDEKSLMRGVMQ